MSEKLSRETVREALAEHERITRDHPPFYPATTIIAAAQAWLDLEDALIIRKVDGEWPIEVHCPNCYGAGWVNQLHSDDIVKDEVRKVQCSICHGRKLVAFLADALSVEGDTE